MCVFSCLGIYTSWTCVRTEDDFWGAGYLLQMIPASTSYIKLDNR